MTAFLLAAALSSLPLFAEDAIQPALVRLRLGDSLKAVQRIHPPSKEQPTWPSYVEPRGRLTRVRVEASYLKKPIKNVDVMWLGFKWGRLVEILLIYDAAYTRTTSVESIAAEWSVIYGEPRRSDEGGYWWADGNTVLRVAPASLPAGKTADSVELRTSVQVYERGTFERVD